MRRALSLLVLLAMLTVSQISKGQSRIYPDTLRIVPPQEADLTYYKKKDFTQAALSVLGLNVGVWAFDRYVQKSDYSYVTLGTIKRNLKDGFKWDNDRMSNNMFLHPYHGNLYFNAARSNGFNFWQSGLFALSGSALWEFFGENEYPSTNDIIVTPIGGMAIGEVAFRTSDLVVDDRAEGWSRFGHEAAIFAISPMRSITRIINGDAWRHRSTPGRIFGQPHISVELSAGARALGFKDRIFETSVGFTSEINMEYGDRYELRSNSPYDYFRLRMNVSVQPSQPLLDQVNILGRLISREIVDESHQGVSLGLYQHFDYYDSDTISERNNKTPYNIAVPAAVGVGVLYRGFDNRPVILDAHTHLVGIIMGGVLSDQYRMDDRNYNLGSGFAIKSGVNLMTQNRKFSLSVDYDYYRIFTWGYPRGTDLIDANPKTIDTLGDDSVAYFGITDIRADYQIAKNLYLTGDFTHYRRVSHYRDFDNQSSTSYATRLMLTYKFN